MISIPTELKMTLLAFILNFVIIKDQHPNIFQDCKGTKVGTVTFAVCTVTSIVWHVCELS